MKTFQIKYINGSNTRFTYSSNIFIHVSAVNLVTIRTWVSWIPLLMDKDKSVLCTCVKAVAPFCGFRHRLSVSHVWEEVPVRRVLTVWLHSRLYHCSRTWTQVFSLLLNNTVIVPFCELIFGTISLVKHYFFGVEYLMIILLLCSFGCEHDGENNTCPEDGHVMNSTSARNTSNIWQFSSCSVSYMKTLLHKLDR